MISIRVTTYRRGAAPPLEARFGEGGGTIGRAPENDLVLADGEQSISRVQARIVCRAGQFAIVDQGGNASALNGEPLVNGHEAPLRPGDELQMGEYALRVEAAAGATPATARQAAGGIPLDWDPFGDDEAAAAAPAARPDASAPAPIAATPVAPAAAPTPAADPPAGDPVAPPDAVLSWQQASGESAATIRSAARLRAPPRPAAATAVAQPPAPESAAPAELAELVAALQEGLGMAEMPVNAKTLTPELMRTLGTLVQEAARGTIELLVARAALKSEIRAEVTVIAARENNPLKFSPSAEVALGHLFGPASPGFMGPERAMRDAYDDLRAHQFGFLAGMRAALEGILKRFDPAELETKLTQKTSMLAALMPSKKKAQMWEVFTELYGQISAEASDDFHRLFGREFLRAYNEYVEQLEGR